MSKRRVLVTGLNGAVGSAIRPVLEERYELVSLSRQGIDGLPPERNFRADIADMDAIGPAFQGVDAVVHLAADGGVQSPHRMDTPWDSMLRNNIVGTYNVFESAAQAGARRIVFASSGATTNGYEDMSPYREIVQGEYDRVPVPWPMVTHESEPRPVRLYGVSKLFGEDLGRYYVLNRGMSVICVRIGGLNPENLPRNAREKSIFTSHRDMSQMAVKCIEAPESVRFDIFYAISGNRWNYRDISHARDVIGYVPEDSADTVGFSRAEEG